jgi:hypothetical protein
MNFIFILLIFCLVLFFYLHIYFQLKTSDDLEIYEIENPSKERLEEICDLRQPVVFKYDKNDNMTKINEGCLQSTIVSKYSAFDVKIRNVLPDIKNEEDISGNSKNDSSSFDGEMYIPLSLTNAINVMQEDKKSNYFSEKNADFLEESGLGKIYKYNDVFLRPHMVSNCIYDYMFGSKGTQTPFRYELNYRNYFMVTEGEVKIKMTPYKSSKYLLPIKDYENFEFRSSINPWNVKEEYKPDFDKIKCLEIILKKGQLFYLPAYWWYSIEFSEKTTSVCSFKYRTYMNIISIFDKLFIHFLQSQNIKRKNITLLKI